MLLIFSIADTRFSCEDTARQSCAMVPRWRIFGDFLPPEFSASRVQQVSDLYLKFALRPHHVADIRSAMAEISRGKTIEERIEEESTGQKYNGLPYSIGRP